MFKKIISLMLVLMALAGMAAIAATPAAAAEDTTIYFQVPEDWNNYKNVFCYIWEYEGEALMGWQVKAGKCTQVEGKEKLYSYDVSKVGGLQSGKVYCVIFSVNTGIQTYDLLLSSSCYGDTVYCDGTKFENPADSQKTAIAAYWKNQNRSTYGPIMGVTSIGNVVGSSLAPGATAESLFKGFVGGNNLISAQASSGKDDQTLIDDVASALGLSQDQVEAIIKETGAQVKWTKAESKAPEVQQEITPDNGSTVGTGQEMTIVYIAIAMMIASAGVVFFARKKRVTE